MKAPVRFARMKVALALCLGLAIYEGARCLQASEIDEFLRKNVHHASPTEEVHGIHLVVALQRVGYRGSYDQNLQGTGAHNISQSA